MAVTKAHNYYVAGLDIVKKMIIRSYTQYPVPPGDGCG